MDIQINIMDLIKLYMKRWWCLLLAVIIGGTIAGVFTKAFITPMYTSYCTLYTENSTDVANRNVTEVNLSTVMVRKELVATYAEILSSNTFLRKVAEQSNLDYTAQDILRMLSMTNKNETEILVISITTANPKHSYIIAQKIVELAPTFISEIVEGGNMKLLDVPEYSNEPSSPNFVTNVQLGMIVGLLISLIIIFVIEMFDNKVKSADAITEAFHYPILGEVPYFATGSKKDVKKKRKKEKVQAVQA